MRQNAPRAGLRPHARDGPPAGGGLLLFGLGQAGYALRGAETLVLIDPWLSTQLEEEQGVTRHVPPALRPEEVEAADLVCITHEHADHLDPRTLGAIAAQVPEAIFLAPAPAVPLVEAAGVARGRIHPAFDSVALEAAGRAGDRGAGRARAASGRVRRLPLLARRAGRPPLPELPGRARRARDLPRRRQHLVAGMEDALRALAPDVAILPINGRDAMREAQAIWGNLNHDEAAALAAAAGVPAVVPCHFDGVAGNLGDPAAFLAALRERGPEIAAHVLHPGDPLPSLGEVQRAAAR